MILSVFIHTIIQAVSGSPDVIHRHSDLRSHTSQNPALPEGGLLFAPYGTYPQSSRAQRDTSSRQTASPHMAVPTFLSSITSHTLLMIRVSPLGCTNLLSDGGYPRNGVIRFAYEVVGLLAGKKLSSCFEFGCHMYAPLA